MGVSSSYQLPPHFQEFTTWPAQRVSSCIKAHTDGEYDIGIDHTVVMALTGRGVDESKVTLLALSKGESHVINAYVFLLCVIMLGEPNRRIEHCQLGMVFDLFDFTSQMQVTMDEFAIMLLCLAQTCGSILSRQAETPKDSVIIEISKELFILAGKEGKGAVITKQVRIVSLSICRYMDCFISLSWLSQPVLSGALESPYLLLLHPTVALASHIAIILTFTFRTP